MIVLSAPTADLRAANYATSLAGLGVTPGDRVAIVTPEQSPEDVIPEGQAGTVCLVLGALRMGAVPVMINPMLTSAERDYIVSDSQASILVDGAEAVLALEDGRSEAAPDLAEHPLGRPMHYTSGTTGRPKGVFADLTEAQARALWLDEQEHWGHSADDLTLVHSPLCHSAPLRFALATVGAGGSVALVGRFQAHRVARAVAELRPTTAFVVPSHLQLLTQLPEGLPHPHYRLLAHAGSPCPPAVKRATHEWAGADRVFEFYGSTEGQFTSCRGTEWEVREGTVGRAREGRTVTVDPGGTIWCEAPDFAAFEYWNAPDKTLQAWRDTSTGRAFTVGDLGHIDDDGYVFMSGRREDLIITGGVNVYPAEVERVLSQCPGVAEVAVYPSPSQRWGQMVCAAFVGDATEYGLRTWARERLAAYKRPKAWIRLSALPRNSMGKVSQQSLPMVTD